MAPKKSLEDTASANDTKQPAQPKTKTKEVSSRLRSKANAQKTTQPLTSKAKPKKASAPTTVATSDSTEPDTESEAETIERQDDISSHILDLLERTRKETQAFRSEFHQTNAANKFVLQPGQLTNNRHGGPMLVVPIGNPYFRTGYYNIGYNAEVKGYKGRWGFFSVGGPGTEEWNAHARLLSSDDWNDFDDWPTAADVHRIRQRENDNLGNDGVTAGIITVWVPETGEEPKRT